MPSVDVDTQLADGGGFPEVAGLMKEALNIVYGIINCDKPIVSAKYYILTCTPITGAEAERIGLVSMAVPDSDVLDVAIDVASGLAQGPQHAVRGQRESSTIGYATPGRAGPRSAMTPRPPLSSIHGPSPDDGSEEDRRLPDSGSSLRLWSMIALVTPG